MRPEDVKIGNYYKIKIKTFMSWQKNDPEYLKSKWKNFSSTDGEIVRAIGKDKYFKKSFKCEYENAKNNYVCIACTFLDILSEKEKNKCRCKIMVTGCICGVFQKEKNKTSEEIIPEPFLEAQDLDLFW